MKSLYPNIDIELATRRMDYRELAEKIGIPSINVYRRLTGKTQWTLPEVVAVCKFFDRTDATILFLRLDIKS